jgi:hypothetical protein
MQSRALCRGEVDQLQEVAGTNEAHLDDSYSFSRILLGCPSLPHQTHYFVAMRSTGLHQGERPGEAKELHQNSFQRSGRTHMQMAFPSIALANVEKCERYFCGSGHTQRVAGSATKASFNASITSTSSDSVAVLTIGNVIKISLIFHDVRNILSLFYFTSLGRIVRIMQLSGR